MTALPPSPFAGDTLAAFGARLRSGALSAEDATRTLLARIAALEPRLAAFTVLAAQRALANAAGIDKLLAAGVDLGPLMGVPIALKDMFTVTGMPTTAGSRVDIADLVPPQGSLVTALQRAGCVIIGKTTTAEFALGGFNLTHPRPWNPCDPVVARMTGGSSHGSAVAMAAELAGFTVGSDTGGSVRWPAAMCGVVGYKATAGHWPKDGVFPLSRHMDSMGAFTASAVDAALVHAALAGSPPCAPARIAGIVLGVPAHHFLEHLDADVTRCFGRALDLLRAAGAGFVDVATAEAAEIDAMGAMVAAELADFLGHERVRANEARIDPMAAARLRAGMALPGGEYLRITARQRDLIALMRERSRGIDAWIMPTMPEVPGVVADYPTEASAAAWSRLNTRNTRPANLFGQCGISLPIHHLGASLPVGLQLCGAPDTDAHLLAVAQAIEAVVGRPSPCAVDAFVAA